jgi:hypothetical protein
MTEEEKKDRKAMIISIPIFILGFIFIVIIAQNENKRRYENCINKGGKAILTENGGYGFCIVGGTK